jgi:membrane-associated phospholipid phosphatase
VIAAGVALIDVVAVFLLEFSVSPQSVATRVAVACAMLAAPWSYARKRPRLARGLEATGLVSVVTLLLGSASYLGVALALPLWDERLAGFDRALGFDWNAHLAYVAASDQLAYALVLSYRLSVLLAFVVIVVLATVGELHRLRQFLLLFTSTLTLVIAVSSLTPALGAYAWHEPPPTVLESLPDARAGRWHLRHFRSLRDGSMRVIPLAGLQGLVTFPSFHTVLAILAAWAIRPARLFRYPAYLFSGAAVLSTLAVGGHYLVDVLGGAAIAVAAIVIVTRRYPGPSPVPLHAREK